MAPCQGTEPAQDHPNGVAGIAFPKLFPDNSAVLWERNGTHSDKRTGSPSLNPSILAVYVAVCGCGWTIVRRTPAPPASLLHRENGQACWRTSRVSVTYGGQKGGRESLLACRWGRSSDLGASQRLARRRLKSLSVRRAYDEPGQSVDMGFYHFGVARIDPPDFLHLRGERVDELGRADENVYQHWS